MYPRDLLVVENESIYNGKLDIGRYATLYIELWYSVCIIQELYPTVTDR